MHRLSVWRGLLGLTAAALLVACSDDGGNPAGPTPPVTTAPRPQSGVTNISGNWTGGQFGFQQNGVLTFANVAATITQDDRAVTGSIRFTSAGWESWHISLEGLLAGAAPDSQFVGNLLVQSETPTGTGTCTGQAVFSGRSTPTAMHWEAVSMTMFFNLPPQPAQNPSSCRSMFSLVSSLLR